MHQRTDSTEVADHFALIPQHVQRLLRELSRKERQLAQKDEELQNCLQAFSHEIRTPLVAIRGFAALCHEEFEQRLPPPWADYLGRIIKNADHLESLVDGMVRLSDLSMPQESLAPTPVRDLIVDVVAQLRLEYRAKDFIVTVDENMPVIYVQADSARQIFTNLLSNAIKYSRPRAVLKIHAGYLADELFHKFFVRDNGIGIHAEQRQRIFAPFVRLHENASAPGKGLGLAIVRRIVGAHGGEIWVDSRPGRGSTFYFTLPGAQCPSSVPGWRPRVIEGVEG
jgi:signal transduction histidine kinase